MAALLEVEHLRAGYGPIEVLKDISLTVDEGEIVALIGANGAGKTSTLMSVSGCLAARSGQVRLAGKDITRLAGARDRAFGPVPFARGAQDLSKTLGAGKLANGGLHPQRRRRHSPGH